jgi:hypothetical protein
MFKSKYPIIFQGTAATSATVSWRLWVTAGDQQRRHGMQKLNSEREDAVQKAVAAKEEAEERLEEERALRDRLIQAAAAGELPRHSAEDGAPPAASPGPALSPSDLGFKNYEVMFTSMSTA